MKENTTFLMVFVLGCGDPEQIDGPCLNDGNTAADEVGDEIPDATVSRDVPRAIDDFRPGLSGWPGWHAAEDLDGFYRMATLEEIKRHQWAEGTMVVATAIEAMSTFSGHAWISIPSWSRGEGAWRQVDGAVSFQRQSLAEVQQLALGHFVEHAQVGEGSRVGADRPVFTLFGLETPLRRGELLLQDGGQFSALFEDAHGIVRATHPHDGKRLDLPAPPGFGVTVFMPAELGVTRDPLEPYACENGICEAPDDPLDECNDGIDNDDDGVADACDWNCLPHADFGADAFPLASSRVENGKSHAVMGGGSICTLLGETWMVEFATMALKASTLLSEVRPEVDDPVRFRVFSCWVFEDKKALDSCQYGPYEVVGEDVDYLPPVCPVGMKDYPYGPTDTDQLSDVDQANLLFEEATVRAWRDVEIGTLALGVAGEPVHGVAFVTSDELQTCRQDTWPLCSPVAGLAYLSPNSPVEGLGSCVVTDANSSIWLTLAHEIGHTLGLRHDLSPGGFMNATGGSLPILGVVEDDPNVDNNTRWELAFESKSSLPRSSGWAHSGCWDDDECAPLGKPGWSCNGLWCVEDF